MLLVFPVRAVALCLVVAGCAGGAGQPVPAKQAPVTAGLEARPAPLPADDVASTPAETLASADLAYESQLGASRGQFDVDRQVAVLRQAVLLYSQFLERAADQPELQAAVRKSRERMADAEATIIFLLPTSKGNGEPPAAKTE